MIGAARPARAPWLDRGILAGVRGASSPASRASPSSSLIGEIAPPAASRAGSPDLSARAGSVVAPRHARASPMSPARRRSSRSTAGRGRRPHRSPPRRRRRSRCPPEAMIANRSRRLSALPPTAASVRGRSGAPDSPPSSAPPRRERRPIRTVVVLRQDHAVRGFEQGPGGCRQRRLCVRSGDSLTTSGRRGAASRTSVDQRRQPVRLLEVAEAGRVRAADVDGQVVGDRGDGRGGREVVVPPIVRRRGCGRC